MRELYDAIRPLPLRSTAWFKEVEAEIRWLLEDAKVAEDATFIEVGSWMGLSTAFFATYADKGRVYAVDTWQGGDDIKGMPMLSRYLPTVYQQFLSNMIAENVSDRVVPVRMSSAEAALGLNLMADAIYLDAAHTAIDVYEDAHRWLRHLKPNGLFFGDDYNWDTVKDGIDQAAKELGREVHSVGKRTWYFPPI